MGIDAQMCLRIKGNFSEEETLKLAVETYKRFSNAFWISSDRSHHCIEKVNEFTQDGDSIFPNKDVEILYGGDSSGVLAEPFNKKSREKLFAHFVKYGHSPYNQYFDHEKDGEICDLCKIPLIRNGWGQNYKAWYCEGCGKKVEERDGIKKVVDN